MYSSADVALSQEGHPNNKIARAVYPSFQPVVFPIIVPKRVLVIWRSLLSHETCVELSLNLAGRRKCLLLRMLWALTEKNSLESHRGICTITFLYSLV